MIPVTAAWRARVVRALGPGLSDTEVQRMVQEAEVHAEEDRARREAIGLINDAESMTFQAENVLTMDAGGRVAYRDLSGTT